MCGRFTLKTNIDTIAQIFSVAPSLDIPPRYNIAPTQQVVSILRNGTSHLEQLQWGLIPSWSKDPTIGSKMINARAETLAEKPSFKRLLRSKRCLIIADGFYEWRQESGTKTKTPIYITLQSGKPFAFAGLWDLWHSPDSQEIRTCTIITTQPNDLMASIHNRMPAILSPHAYEQWLDPTLHDEHALSSLLTPYSTEDMAARAVSRLVNDPRREGAELLA